MKTILVAAALAAATLGAVATPEVAAAQPRVYVGVAPPGGWYWHGRHWRHRRWWCVRHHPYHPRRCYWRYW